MEQKTRVAGYQGDKTAVSVDRPQTSHGQQIHTHIGLHSAAQAV